MDRNLIFLPMLAQVFLVMVVYIKLAVRKAAARKEINPAETALNPKAWPDDVVKVSNNVGNQFELPVLYYVVCMVMWGADGVTTITLTLAWLFVISRAIHAWVHTGSNHVPTRLRMFMIGFLVLLIMWGFSLWTIYQQSM